MISEVKKEKQLFGCPVKTQKKTIRKYNCSLNTHITKKNLLSMHCYCKK